MPKMSAGLETMSALLIPCGTLDARLVGSGLLSGHASCTSAAQHSASTTLANSTKRSSPVVLTIVP